MILPVSCALKSGVIQRVILGVVRWRPRAPVALLVCSPSLLRSIPLCAWATLHVSVPLLTDIWVVSGGWLPSMGWLQEFVPTRLEDTPTGGGVGGRVCARQLQCAWPNCLPRWLCQGPSVGKSSRCHILTRRLWFPFSTVALWRTCGGASGGSSEVRHLSMPVAAGCPLV